MQTPRNTKVWIIDNSVVYSPNVVYSPTKIILLKGIQRINVDVKYLLSLIFYLIKYIN